MMDETAALLQIHGLQKTGAGRTVLDIPEFQVAGGEIVGLVGPAGSGKTPLLRLLLGQDLPTAGSVRVAGLDPHSDRQALSRLVGVLFAEEGLYRQRSAAGNLRFHARLHALPAARVDTVLTLVGLQDQAQTRVEQLSSSLRRRLALGVALLHEPRLLFLVDPFVRCDEASIGLISGCLQAQAAAGSAIVILAGSEAHLADLCDTRYALAHGRLTMPPQTAARPQALPFKVPVRLEGSVALINPGDILFAAAQDGRAYLQLAGERLLTQYTLADLETRLGRSGFFRAHRSYLVNLQHVREVIPYTRASYSLRLNDAEGTEIPLSRDAARELRELLDY